MLISLANLRLMIQENILEEREDEEEIPKSIDYKGEWIKPNLKHYITEISLAACYFDVSPNEIRSKLKITKPVELSENIWKSLENSNSSSVNSVERAKEITDEHGKHYNQVLYSYLKNRPVHMAGIAAPKSGKPYLIFGEVELMFAHAFHIRPIVLIINV
jgi:hypothetical protein